MKALALITLLLTGCAGTPLDVDFRSKVASASGDLKLTPSADGQTVGVEASESIVFRDPKMPAISPK